MGHMSPPFPTSFKETACVLDSLRPPGRLETKPTAVPSLTLLL